MIYHIAKEEDYLNLIMKDDYFPANFHENGFVHGSFDIKAGQAFVAEKDEWVKYSTPYKDGAEYISVCFPAFSPDMVNRDQ